MNETELCNTREKLTRAWIQLKETKSCNINLKLLVQNRFDCHLLDKQIIKNILECRRE